MGKLIVGSNPTLSASPFPLHASEGYHAGAVLGGELAVPCTCNPLQQG